LITETNRKVTDLEAIRLYLENRDTRYFNILYQKYAVKIYSKSVSLLKDEGLAKDATQEIFIKIFANLHKFNEKSKFSTWVYSITYNFCIDVIRKQKKARNIFSDEMERAPDIVEDVSDASLMEMEVGRLKVVLENIPIGDKAVLLMKYQDDMQIKEIAKTLDKTESAIKMKIKRAKHKAQQVYKNLYPNNE